MTDCKVCVLGTEYSIQFVDHFPKWISDLDETSDGCCESYDRMIYIKTSGFENWTEEGKECRMKRVLRHELTHAFLCEAGLGADTANYYGGWSYNEEMVDWIAAMFPKMMKAFEEVGCL